MANDSDYNIIPRPKWGPRALWAAPFAALMILIPLAAACSGGSASPGVANIGSTPAAGDDSTGDDGSGSNDSPEPNAVAYAQCMRDNGVPHFPDPDSDGNFALGLSPDKPDLDINSPQFQAAQEACKSLEPRRSAEEEDQIFAAQLKFSQCMRDQGISDFPDPRAPGSGPNTQSQSGSDLDPDSPQFQAAQEACMRYLDDLPGEFKPSTNEAGQ